MSAHSTEVLLAMCERADSAYGHRGAGEGVWQFCRPFLPPRQAFDPSFLAPVRSKVLPHTGQKGALGRRRFTL
jgi:hypothetical protein